MKIFHISLGICFSLSAIATGTGLDFVFQNISLNTSDIQLQGLNVTGASSSANITIDQSTNYISTCTLPDG